MADFDNSYFLGLSWESIFGSGLVSSQFSKRTSVAVLETDGKTFVETDRNAVREKVSKTKRPQDGQSVCGPVDIETVRESIFATICDTDPETGTQRGREYQVLSPRP
jgi:hypothetical protein